MKRIPEIDGIRGIAILLVVSFHYLNNQLVNSSNSFAKCIAGITGFGWVGVDLFFVLSGFLIGSILITKKKSKNYFSTFFIRRILRIVPNYYLLLIIFSLICYSGYFKSNYFLTQNNTIPLWSYFLMFHNFLMASSQNLGNDSMNVVWSIGIEEQFYILFPFILWKLNIKWVPYLLSFFISLAIYSRMQYDHWIPRYVLLNCRIDSLSFGVMIAWIMQQYNVENFCKKNKFALFILLFITIITCAIWYSKFGDLGVYKHTLFAFIFSILIILGLGLNKNWYGNFLRNRILRWVGSISYSLYLFHYLILGLVHFWSGKRGIIIEDINDVFLTLFAFILSLLISIIIFKFLETPMIKIGKKYSY